VIAKIVAQEVSMLMLAFYSNMGFPLYVTVCHIRLSAEILVRICEGS